MGPGGISIWQLLIILLIVVLLFGTKKLRGMGGDMGAAIKSFKKSVKEESSDSDETEALQDGSTSKVADADTAQPQKEQA